MKPFYLSRQSILFCLLIAMASLGLAWAGNPDPPAIELDRKTLSEQRREPMIIRTWKARTTDELEQQYLAQVRQVVLPYLQTFSGYRGAYFTKRQVDGGLEILVLTYWKSRAAVQEFAGDEESHTYILPEIVETLTSYDSTSDHFEVLIEDIAE